MPARFRHGVLSCSTEYLPAALRIVPLLKRSAGKLHAPFEWRTEANARATERASSYPTTLPFTQTHDANG
jgi:hypothetical protein